MTGILLYGFYGLIVVLTFGGVEIFRRWSRRRELYDVPNERSSHRVPTPRGGGLIIVVVCLGVYAISGIFAGSSFQWAYLAGASLVALISWLDDLHTISFVWRFLIHTLAAALLIFNTGYFEILYLPVFGAVNVGGWGIGLTFLWIVWLTNAYNFMDGIDGIAGTQAVTAGIGWFLVGTLLGLPSAAFYGGVVACAAFGFLLENWQPAKIFMGDVGSAFLGYTFAALPLLAQSENRLRSANAANNEWLLPAAALLIWLFVFDTLWTFGRRVWKRERVWEAHRGHLYQRLTGENFSHRFVSLLYGAVSALNVGLAVLFLQNRAWEILIVIFVVGQSIGLLILTAFYDQRRSASKE
ncbi:MAG: glycosyltransferase family 4 protein [Acidobacteriota bacterium]|nr:glycosyltransferase family 4 protein [Acidobacteriota bacterium]